MGEEELGQQLIVADPERRGTPKRLPRMEFVFGEQEDGTTTLVYYDAGGAVVEQSGIPEDIPLSELAVLLGIAETPEMVDLRHLVVEGLKQGNEITNVWREYDDYLADMVREWKGKFSAMGPLTHMIMNASICFDGGDRRGYLDDMEHVLEYAEGIQSADNSQFDGVVEMIERVMDRIDRETRESSVQSEE